MVSFAKDDKQLPVSQNETQVGKSWSIPILDIAAMTESMKLEACVKMAVASCSLVGVGCSTGYYLAPAGYFEYKFERQSFFLQMLAALCLPYPVMLVLQEKFDQQFDSLFGPRQTYFCRIIAVQMMLAATLAGYSLSGESPTAVLVCGVLIGSLSAAAWSSTMQLMSAWDPSLTAWASVGKDAAGATPVITYFMLGFSASAATAREFQSMQLFPIVLICICAVCLTGLHASGIWDKAYARLGYDLWDDEEDETTPRADGSRTQRQVTETDALLQRDDLDSSGQPFWTPKWQFASAFNIFLSFMCLPLVTCMRDPNLTQRLTLGKLAMDCISRCVAALSANTDVFGLQRPRHYTVIAQLTLRTALFSLLMAHILSHMTMHVSLFLVLWLLFYFDGSFLDSQIDVTLVRFAPVALRKGIIRRSNLANYTGLVVSLAVDIIILFAL